ncbi:aminopeptidase N-like [Polyergus mexicanus]|uniref:aminopeptidase N-like n=1 Tax=Polyergus mexicanus TaxID=615972 RepID=UPI0038B5BFE8
MVFLKLLLNSVLIFIGETAPLINTNWENNSDLATQVNNWEHNSDLATAYRLPDYIQPNYYILSIQFTEAKHFSGDCNVHIKINRPTWSISLHAQQPKIKIKNIILIKEWVHIFGVPYYWVPTSSTYNNESHILAFHFPKKLSEGFYLLKMKFDATLNDGESIFKTFIVNEKGNQSFLATSFQAIGARQIFPCWDEPTFKSIFNISIKHHKSCIVLSNMPKNLEDLEERHTIDKYDVMVWTRFNYTPAISTYLVAFLVTSNVSYEVAKFPKIGINIWCRSNLVPQIKFARSIIAHVISFFDKNTTSKEDLEKISTVQHVLVPNLPHNSIKKWKLIFYRETALTYDDEVDSVAHKIQIAHLIAREMVHQWLNIRMNSASWWSYHWLYEGIATLLGIDIINKIYPESRITELYVVQIQQESLRLDTHSIMEPLTSTINRPSEINSLFSFSYYIKAPSILRMLRYCLTDDVFYEGLEIFFKKQSATLDDFWDAMQTTYDVLKISTIGEFNVKEKLDSWTRQKHYPILKVREHDSHYLNISIENIDSLELDMNLRIPLTIVWEKHMESKSSDWHTIPHWWITLSSKTKLFFPRFMNEWIIINLQQIGYYRVNYESDNWLRIANYLNNITLYKNIHILNRAQIIDDAYYFVMNGQLKPFIFFELIKYLSQEKDYVAWYPMFKALEDMSTILPFSDERIYTLKSKLMNNLFKLLLEIKYDESSQDDDLTKCLRHEAAKWICLLGDTECWKIANTKLKEYLKNSTQTELFQGWKDWMYCNGLIPSNSLTWDTVRQTYTWKLDRKLLKFLSCSTNIFTIKYRMLTKVPKDRYDQIQVIDHLYYFHNIIERHARRDQVLNYILTKFADVKPRQLNGIIVLIDLINHVYSEKQLKMIKEFVDTILIRNEITVILEYDIITQDEVNDMNR